MPICVGASLTTCQTRLDNAGLKNVRVERLTTEDADLDKGPNEVLSTSPPAGGDIDPGDEVRLVVNPTEALFPHVVPDCTGLTYTECANAIADAGFDSSVRDTLSFEDADPYPHGMPNEVFDSSPRAGQRATRATEVHVSANPPDADLPRLVPAPDEDEQYDAYAARVGALDLVPNKVTLQETEWDFSPDAVVSTSPGEGTRVRRGTQVDVPTNPPTDERTHFDTRCEPSAPLNRDPSPERGTAFLPRYDVFPGTGSAPRGEFIRNPAFSADPTKPGKPGKNGLDFPTTWLRYGWAPPSSKYAGRAGGWGYRHTAWNHGWTAADDTQTRQALLVPAFEGNADHRVHIGPTFKVNGLKCVRRVVVALGIERSSYGTDPQPKGIITSYAQPEAEVFGR
jgi:hypothetical protein